MDLHPNVTVEVQMAGWNEYWTRLQTQVAGGIAPDVGMADQGRVLDFSSSDVIIPIDDLVKASNFPLADLLKTSLTCYTCNKGDFALGAEGGQLWAIPSDGAGMVFYYNRKMFDAAGVSYPTDDWTWDNMLEAAKKLTLPDKNQYGISSGAPGLLTQRGIWSTSANAPQISEDYKKSLLDAPESIAVYKFFWDLMHTHKVTPPPAAATDTGVSNPFLAKQVAMHVDGTWVISGDYAKGLKDDEWDIALFPKHPVTGRRHVDIGADGWWIFKGSQDYQAAWDLASYMGGETGVKALTALGYLVPQANKAEATKWYAQKPPDHRAKALENEVLDSSIWGNYYGFTTVLDATMVPLTAAFADGTDIEAACKEAAKIMDDELAKDWKQFQGK